MGQINLPLGVDKATRIAIQKLSAKLTGNLTPNRLLYYNDGDILSVDPLTNWVAGTANEINVADDGDGTITIGIVDPLIVAKGGTGATTLTDHALVAGSGTGAITPLAAATDGQIPIGYTGADPTIAAITGTAKRVLVSNGAGSITLSGPQDIDTVDSPTFAGLTITNACVLGSNSVVFQPNTDSTTFLQVLDADGGTPVFNVDTTNEKVGIGTNAPSEKLEVVGPVIKLDQNNGVAVFWAATTGAGGYAQFYATSPDNSLTFGAFPNDYLQVGEYTGKCVIQGTVIALAASGGGEEIQLYSGGRAAGDRTMTLTAAHDVGIGTTAPVAKLQVAGDLDVLTILNIGDELWVAGDKIAGETWLRGDSTEEFNIKTYFTDKVQQAGANKFKIYLRGEYSGGSTLNYVVEIDEVTNPEVHASIGNWEARVGTITDCDHSSSPETITVRGNFTDILYDNDTFAISDSASNNNTGYKIDDASMTYDSGENTTTFDLDAGETNLVASGETGTLTTDVYNNTFKWSDDGGNTWDDTGVETHRGSPWIELNNDITFTFSESDIGTSVFVVGDQWTFTANTNPTAVFNVDSTNSIVTVGGDVGISETAPETPLEITTNAPYITLHNLTEEDTDGGGESSIIFKREDGAGTETACFKFEASHDGVVANNQLGKGIWSVNTGAGLVQVLEIGSDLKAIFAGNIKASPLVESVYTGTSSWETQISAMSPNMPDGNFGGKITFGRSEAANDGALIGFIGSATPGEEYFELGIHGFSGQFVLTGDGNIGINETAPETPLEITHATPYLTLHNSAHEDGDGGRESRLNFKGEQSGGEETTLARIQVSHDGSADDQKGDLIFYINDGDDSDTPTERLRIDSAGLATFNQSITAANYTATNLLTACATNAGELDFTAASKKLDVEDNAVVSQDYSSDASPTFAGLTVTNATVLGSNSVVFQPNADSTTFLQVLDADGGNPIFNVDSTNERIGIGTATPTVKLDVEGQGRLSSATYPVLEVERDTGGGNIYAGIKLQRISGSPVAGVGIGQYFTAPNSVGTETFSGLFGGRLSTITNGSEIGELVFVPSYHGDDPWNDTPTMVVMATGVGSGRVGIGATPPGATLEVSSTVDATPGAGNGIYLTAGGKTAQIFTRVAGRIAFAPDITKTTNFVDILNDGDDLLYEFQAAGIAAFRAYQTPVVFETRAAGGALTPISFEIDNVEKMRIAADGNIGIGEIAPETQLEMTGTAPYLTFHNSTHEDGDGGRESRLNFKGEQSGGEETTLAKIEAGHDGAADDHKGYLDFFTNDGDDGDAPTKQIRVAADGGIHIANMKSGTDQADSGAVAGELWFNSIDNTVKMGV